MKIGKCATTGGLSSVEPATLNDPLGGHHYGVHANIEHAASFFWVTALTGPAICIKIKTGAARNFRVIHISRARAKRRPIAGSIWAKQPNSGDTQCRSEMHNTRIVTNQ